MTVTTMDEFNRLVAAEVRAEMGRQQLTQAELAEALGWDQRRLSRRLNNDVALSTNDIECISWALSVPISKLTGQPAGSESPAPE